MNTPWVEQEIDETLQSLEGIERARVDSLFCDRVMEKIHRRENGRVFDPVVALRCAVVCGMIAILNAVVFFHFHRAEDAYMTIAAETISADYFPHTATVYAGEWNEAE